MNTYDIFKKIAFQLDPETAHTQSMRLLSRFPESLATFMGAHENLNQEELDLSVTLKDGNVWSFPVGLAAGLDKNAEAINFFTSIPFGAVEVGTVTPKPQEGNPKPRMFRLIEDKSLLNRMGFNNEGMEKIYSNLVSSDRHGKTIGVNLGKNKVTPQDKAVEDYQVLYEKFAPHCQYLVINVSSPNTPGLRDLQNIESLRTLFSGLTEQREKVATPLYLKISPDLSLDDIPAIVELASEFKLSGLIATNTTIRPDIGVGGISGKLLKEKARGVRAKVLEVMGENSSLEFIGVGGIDSYDDLVDFWRLGGRVCQIYTSFIYQGPQILLTMKERLQADMKNRGIKNMNDFFAAIRNS